MWPGSSRVGGVAPTYDTPVPDVGRGYAPDTRAPSVARVTFRQTPRHRRSGLRPRRPASSPYPGFRLRPAPHLVVGPGYAPDDPRPPRTPGFGFDRPRRMSYVPPTPPPPPVLTSHPGSHVSRPTPLSIPETPTCPPPTSTDPHAQHTRY